MSANADTLPKREVDKTMPAKLKNLCPLIILAALMGGCSWFPFFSDKSKEAPQVFTDLPVPPELAVNDGDSQVYEGEGGRVGRLLASGRIDRVAVIQYYREAMLRNGWELEGEFDGEDRYMMVFVKKPRSAAITIKAGWVYTDVEINVSARKK